MKTLLLLTGCIKPNCTDEIVCVDWQKRQEMYVNAITWYLENTDYDLTFCENSGTDISPLFAKWGGRVEFLTYYSAPTIPDRSRSYKEMEILEYVQDHSQKFKHADMVVKITGRLELLNIKELVSSIANKVKNVKNGFVSAYKHSKKPWSDCKFIFFSPNFLHYLTIQKEKTTATYPFEWATGDAIRAAIADGLKFVYPPYLDRVHGQGMNGGVYDKTPWQYFKGNLKNKLRAFLFDIGYFPKN